MKSDEAKIAHLQNENEWLYKRLKAQEEDHELALRELAKENYELKQLVTWVYKNPINFNKGKCDHESCTHGK